MASGKSIAKCLGAAFLSLVVLASTACSFSLRPFSLAVPGEHRREAEKLRTEGKLEEAIEQYHLHIAERTDASNKFPGENPSFYYIIIGDLQLERGEPEAALQSYLTAHDKLVMKEFIVDRLRQVSAAYEAKEEYKRAISLLNKYRDLDPLLFDWDIDRLHKLSIKKEQEADTFELQRSE